MKTLILLLLIIPTVSADTSFFDNPNDAFIMGDLLLEPPSGGGDGYSPPLICNSLWVCDEWLGCQDDIRIRTCVDINYCEDSENPPLLLSCNVLLPTDRIVGCVLLNDLDILIGGWKANVYRFDIINDAINHWKYGVDC